MRFKVASHRGLQGSFPRGPRPAGCGNPLQGPGNPLLHTGHHTRRTSEEPMNEADCIRRARNGDAEAMRDLYRRYAPRVHAVVRRLAGDDALAEDWAQEAWVRAFRALPSFRGDS